jgi:beta-lactam-binding protein with PASTA domain
MTFKDIFSKGSTKFVWLNLLAMAFTVTAVVLGTLYGLDIYTHHNEEITVPSLKDMQYSHAQMLLERGDLVCVVRDTGYVKGKPEGCILYQTPVAGSKVKSGRVIYVTINSSHVPTMPLPDIADNSSMREAQARLQAMGFRLGKIEYVQGEKDWVVGVKVHGHKVFAGDRIPTDALVVLIVGDGTYDGTFDESEETVMPDEDFSLENIGELVTGASETAAPAKQATQTAPEKTEPSQKTSTTKKKTGEDWF